MRRNIKKLTATLLITTLALSSFVGCGKSKNTADNNDSSTVSTKDTPTEPATVTSEMSITTIDENGNEVVLTGTAVTDADGNVTLTAVDESGNTVE